MKTLFASAFCLSLILGGATLSSAEPTTKPSKKETPKLNTKCPVSGDDITDSKSVIDYKGRKVAFCCEECIKDFEKDPAKFEKKLK